MNPASTISLREGVITPIYLDRALHTSDIKNSDSTRVLDIFAPNPQGSLLYYTSPAKLSLIGVVCFIQSFRHRNDEENNRLSPLVGILFIVATIWTVFIHNIRGAWEASKSLRTSGERPFIYQKQADAQFCSYLLRMDHDPSFDRYYGLMSVEQILGGLKIAQKHESRNTLIAKHYQKFDPYIRNLFEKVLQNPDLNASDILNPLEKKPFICSPYRLQIEAAQIRKQTTPDDRKKIRRLENEIAGDTLKLLTHRTVDLNFSFDERSRVNREYFSSLSETTKAMVAGKQVVELNDISLHQFNQLTKALDYGVKGLEPIVIIRVANLASRFGLNTLLLDCLVELVESKTIFTGMTGDERFFKKNVFSALQGVSNDIADGILEICLMNVPSESSWILFDQQNARAKFVVMSELCHHVGLPSVPEIIKEKATDPRLRILCGLEPTKYEVNRWDVD